jgi:hypothetical protein
VDLDVALTDRPRDSLPSPRAKLELRHTLDAAAFTAQEVGVLVAALGGPRGGPRLEAPYVVAEIGPNHQAGGRERREVAKDRRWIAHSPREPIDDLGVRQRPGGSAQDIEHGDPRGGYPQAGGAEFNANVRFAWGVRGCHGVDHSSRPGKREAVTGLICNSIASVRGSSSPGDRRGPLLMKTLHLLRYTTAALIVALPAFALPLACGGDDGHDHADHGHDDHHDHGHDDDHDDHDHGETSHDDHGHDGNDDDHDDHGHDGNDDDHEDHGHDDHDDDHEDHGDPHEDLCDEACAPFDACNQSTQGCHALCEADEALADAAGCEHEWEGLWHCVEELDSCDDIHNFAHGHGTYPCSTEEQALDDCIG